MDELTTDWKQDRPEGSTLKLMWDLMQINAVEKWSEAAERLKEKFEFTHSNGGIQLHKYKIEKCRSLDWFVSRNRLDEINFIDKFLKKDELLEYRTGIQISDKKFPVHVSGFKTDIYNLPGELARMLGQGGAYQKIPSQVAWRTAVDFIQDEFQNRFDEFIMYSVAIDSAEWFYDVAWDYSVFLFDKRNYIITLIAITDTD